MSRQKGFKQEQRILTHCRECGDKLPEKPKCASNWQFCPDKLCHKIFKDRKYAGKYRTAGGWRMKGIKDVDGTLASIATFNRLLIEQNNTCAICDYQHDPNAKSQGGKLYLDHDHDTGQVRGLLCHKHNLALGILGDNEAGVRKLLAYLAT